MPETPKRFPNLAALREHLRHPTAAMFVETDYRAEREAFLKELADNKTLILSRGGRLMCYKRLGYWQVSAPGVVRHIPSAMFDVGSKAKALLFAELMENGLGELPWDRDELLDAMRAYPDGHGGRSVPGTILRLVAGDPVLDPQGIVASHVAQEDESRARQERVLARETAAGYTERIKVSQIEPGDDISYRYHGKVGYTWRGVGICANRDWMSLTVRARVLDEGREMTRHGNNHDEFKDGLQFRAENVSWLDDNGDAAGVRPDGARVPTVDWLTRVLRKPKKAAK